VIIAQTVCVPMSLLPVLQNPSLNTPVTGFKQHISRAFPKTFNCPTLYEFYLRIFNLNKYTKYISNYLRGLERGDLSEVTLIQTDLCGNPIGKVGK
jgi:hypothetical protein